MKIKLIKISNIHSFGDYEDFSQATELAFDTGSIEGSKHILIGPNGSGKSNFIDVVSQIFHRELFVSSLLNEKMMKQPDAYSTIELREAITIDKNTLHPEFEKNRYGTTDIMKVLFVFDLNTLESKFIQVLSFQRALAHNVC